MQNLDAFSYQCGVIDCFNEMVYAGLKTLALSRPMDTAQERDALWEVLGSGTWSIFGGHGPRKEITIE